jgi:predicted nuclease of restriction endonuclease-like (RecB) superfamily
MTKRGASAKAEGGYRDVLAGVVDLLESARHAAARSVNAAMTATYWEIGRRIVEFEQRGRKRAGYGEELLARLSEDLSSRFGRGFSQPNLDNMRLFYLAFPPHQIWQTLSARSARASPAEISQTVSRKLRHATGGEICQTPSGKSATLAVPQTASAPFDLGDLARAFPLPWSHYVVLIRRSRSAEAVDFYHTEALRGGWTVRQLDRQIGSQFYERTALSRNKAAMLRKGAVAKPEDAVTPEEEIKDPLVLEFLGLKDEYSETELEEALIQRIETFLLELGNDFAFVGRQRRLRIDDEWYRVDLLFFHRRIRCLVIIDLKLDRFTHADAGQMHMYLNYAREHWTQPGENPPVGIILCTTKGEALVRYAMEGLPNAMLVREYLTALPDGKALAAEIQRTRRLLEGRLSREKGGEDRA